MISLQEFILIALVAVLVLKPKQLIGLLKQLKACRTSLVHIYENLSKKPD